MFMRIRDKARDQNHFKSVSIKFDSKLFLIRVPVPDPQAVEHDDEEDDNDEGVGGSCSNGDGSIGCNSGTCIHRTEASQPFGCYKKQQCLAKVPCFLESGGGRVYLTLYDTTINSI